MNQTKRMSARMARIAVLALLAAAMCGGAAAQAREEPPDRAVVPLSKPGQPAKIEVSVMRGSVTVKAYEGKDIIVEARTREKALTNYLAQVYATGVPYPAVAPPAPPAPPAAPKAAERLEEIQKKIQDIHKENEARLMAQLAEQERLARRIERQRDRAVDVYGQYLTDEKKRQEEKQKKIAGMKQLSGTSSGLEIEEEGNVVQVRTESWKAATDLVIQAPAATSLEISSSMDGVIVVEGIGGEIDINNMNGPVTLRNVSGNTLVHTVNGDIDVALVRIAGDKPLSFSSMTGDIDVTLPADVKANIKMKSYQGEIYTDFDMDMTRQASRTEGTEKTEAGKYRISFDKSLVGLVNGGGREISFNTFRGNIYIRKKR
ncbi:MAG TPA: DUF4097 family beta strand repeat-containing protein [Candidatus Aminicenantes bacterium]|nr:DUF4097 family beta strand repeat-containing protein [Candidatus Aminicenantes bacterium]